MSTLPALKHFKITVGVTFDYTWQYLSGNSVSSSPIDLTHLTATWILYNPTTNVPYVTYHNGVSTGASGVHYGGMGSDPTNGIVDLVINSVDSALITWRSCAFTLSFADTSAPPIVALPLEGTIAVLGVLL